MEKGKFNRVALDPSQLQMFLDEVIEGGAGGGLNDYELSQKTEPTQEQLREILNKRPDRVILVDGENKEYLYKQDDHILSVLYANIGLGSHEIFGIKIEQSGSEITATPYEITLPTN